MGGRAERMHIVEHWKRNLEEFLERNSGPLFLLASLFVIGVIFGALAVRGMEARDRLEAVRYFSRAIPIFGDPPKETGAALLKQALLRNFKILGGMWILGISVVGTFGVMVMALVRGFSSGFAVGFLAAEFGLPGVVHALAHHLPHSLLEVPALILAGTASLAFALRVVRSWREGRRVQQFYRALGSYTGRLIVIGLLLVAASMVEAFLTPALVRLVTPMLEGG